MSGAGGGAADLVAGIDVGCGSTKCVVMDEAGNVRGRGFARTVPGFERVADEALRGAFRLFPEARFVLDVGAQTTRAIRLRDGGRVAEFHVNEKCAAGSGGFIERAARYLEVPLEEVGALSLGAKDPKRISSVCAVLAESEIVNQVSAGAGVPDILRGVHDSLADRAHSQLRRVGAGGPVVFCGGVALQAGMIAAAEAVLGAPVLVPEHPRHVAALGAAWLGWQRLRRAGGGGGGGRRGSGGGSG